MAFTHWISTPGRKVALAAIAAVLLLQLGFSLPNSSCNTGSLLQVGLVCLIPALGLALTRAPIGATVVCIVLSPFFLWANYVECVAPYKGGGAAMAYVVVFLFGVPLSIVFGLAAFAAGRTRHEVSTGASTDDNNSSEGSQETPPK